MRAGMHRMREHGHEGVGEEWRINGSNEDWSSKHTNSPILYTVVSLECRLRP
jgi:hypothetical protein